MKNFLHVKNYKSVKAHSLILDKANTMSVEMKPLNLFKPGYGPEDRCSIPVGALIHHCFQTGSASTQPPM
jgi:hypothetical protein